jgi:GH15 family glucan-1,4-alpha-glucosidase
VINSDQVPLGSRGAIGDTASAALVGVDGTIDWYCPRRLDGPAAFFRILDPAQGSAVRVGPAGLGPAARRRLSPGGQRYDPATNVLRTRLSGPDGEIEIADFMPWPGGTERPQGRIVRLVTARRGPVDVQIEVIPGRGFASATDVSTWSGGVAFGDLVVRSPLSLRPEGPGRDRPVWRASRRLEPGEQLVVTVDDRDDDHQGPLSPDAAERAREATASAWQRHVFGLTYGGPYRQAVERSVLAVKLLQSYASGSIAAAATMSLPEIAGGERNDDRRLAWIRDAALAVVVLDGLDLGDDRLAAEGWLRGAVESSAVPLPAVFDLEGGPAAPEEELRLPGRLRSEPVRSGSHWSAVDAPPEGRRGGPQDALGDLVAAIAAVAPIGGPLSAVWPDLVPQVDWLSEHWNDPDQGVWELRSPPRRLAASRVQAWFALDTAARMASARNPLDLDAAGWRQSSAEVLRWLERHGLAADGGLRMDDQPGDLPDAALLRVAWRGPWPALTGGRSAPVVARTVDRVLKQLSSGALVHRYPPEVDDGRAGTPGADLAASFWAVRALAALGRWEEAHDRMETLCGLAQPLGLLGESVHAVSGQLLGNLPSAHAHLSLMAAAAALESGPR